MREQGCLSDGTLYLVSNWAVFDLCEAELGLACDFHGIFKAVTIPAGEHRIKLCSSHLRFTRFTGLFRSRTCSYLIVILSSDLAD